MIADRFYIGGAKDYAPPVLRRITAWRTVWRDDRPIDYREVAVILDTTFTEAEAVARAMAQVRADDTLDPAALSGYTWTCEEVTP